MKKVLKVLGWVIALLFVALLGVWIFTNEKEPAGETGASADALAEAMMVAVNKPAWDTTALVQWSFMGLHDYVWDKERNLVQVRWGDSEVLLDTKQVDGKAYQDGQELTDAAATDAIKKAWGYFCNDSFWLNPVVKAFDSGTERSIVTLDDGRTGLKVSYTSGGVTPGDAYLWILDAQNRPTAWKMWCQILPVGGIETSWENWQTLSTGALISTTHDSSLGKTDMLTNVKAAMSWETLGLDGDPFARL